MVQRGPTYIMSRKQSRPLLFGGNFPYLSSLKPGYVKLYTHPALYTEGAPPTDIADRISASFPMKAGKSMSQQLTKRLAEADRYICLLSAISHKRD